MKNVLIIGLGYQGRKYINYFLKDNYDVFGVCKTQKTKDIIDKEFAIDTSLSIEYFLDKKHFEIIIFALPQEVQGEIVLKYIKRIEYVNKIIIEIPISNDSNKIELIKRYDNMYFFLEEYYSLLGKFLRKIDISNVDLINVNLYININDKESIENNLVHINNNFLGLELYDKVVYNYVYLTNSDFENDNLDYGIKRLCYNISFLYNGINIFYDFGYNSVYLRIGDKEFIDNWNFSNNLTKILTNNNSFKNIYCSK